MTNKKRIEELERRVKELESRPIVYPPVIILQPGPQPLTWPAALWNPLQPYQPCEPIWYVDYNSLPRCQ